MRERDSLSWMREHGLVVDERDLVGEEVQNPNYVADEKEIARVGLVDVDEKARTRRR